MKAIGQSPAIATTGGQQGAQKRSCAGLCVHCLAKVVVVRPPEGGDPTADETSRAV